MEKGSSYKNDMNMISYLILLGFSDEEASVMPEILKPVF
jgi:hypothetical protein